MIEAAVKYDPHPGETGDPAVLAAVDQAEAELAELTGVVNAANARIAELVSTLLTNGGWCQAGIHSPEHYLGWKMGISPTKARQYVTIAKRLGELPECAVAFEKGELSVDQAATVAQHAPPWTDHQVCGHAKLMTLRQLRHVLTHYVFEPPSPPHEEPEPGPERRQVRFGADGRGRWRLNADLPADEGAFVEQALEACRDDLFHQRFPAHSDGSRGSDGEERHSPSEVCWADALAEMAERATAAGAVARPHADRYRVLFHHEIDPSGAAGLVAHRSEERLPDVLRRYWTCDGTAVPVTRLDGAPVNVGRSHRIVPDGVRRLIERRDGGCIIAGCTARHYLVIHHLIHWSDGGATGTWNLAAICQAHHRDVHRGLLHITGNADEPGGLVITDHRGRALTGAARAAPPGRPPVRAAQALRLPVGTWRHPLGERLRYDDVVYNPPRPPRRS